MISFEWSSGRKGNHLNSYNSTSRNECLPILARRFSECGNDLELGNDVEVFKLQPQSDHLFAEGGEVVPVGFADLFDQSVKASRFSSCPASAVN